MRIEGLCPRNRPAGMLHVRGVAAEGCLGTDGLDGMLELAAHGWQPAGGKIGGPGLPGDRVKVDSEQRVTGFPAQGEPAAQETAGEPGKRDAQVQV